MASECSSPAMRRTAAAEKFGCSRAGWVAISDATNGRESKQQTRVALRSSRHARSVGRQRPGGGDGFAVRH